MASRINRFAGGFANLAPPTERFQGMGLVGAALAFAVARDRIVTARWTVCGWNVLFLRFVHVVI